MQSPSNIHFAAAKRVLRYLKGTVKLWIWFGPVEDGNLLGFVDSNWAGNDNDMKSTIEFWCVFMEFEVTQSTAEGTYAAASTTINKAIWLRKILKDIRSYKLQLRSNVIRNQQM